MIKLNNRGFAVSTILYGILALTIIILMLIFGIMRANKDMNQDLASSIEDNINKCTLSEVELENCYFSNGTCNTKEYYSCIGKESINNTLYSVVQIGDFVNYDAGVWPLTLSMPNYSDLFSFGGYEAGVSKNSSLNYVGYDGWRVLYKNDNNVYLIHGGISEFFSLELNSLDKNIYNYENIIKGSSSKEYNEKYNYTVKNWNNEYLNSEYAELVRNITVSDLEIWKEQTGKNYINSNLVHVNEMYLFSDIDEENHKVKIYDCDTGSIITESKGIFGIRPIIKLKQDVKTSGYITNTYGMKEWILVK